MPWEEVETVVTGGQFLALLRLRLGPLGHLKELAFLPFSGRFNDGNAVQGNGRQRSGNDFGSLVWELGANLPELGNVQTVDGARAHGRGHTDAAVVVAE